MDYEWAVIADEHDKDWRALEIRQLYELVPVCWLRQLHTIVLAK